MDFSGGFFSVLLLIVLMFVLSNMYVDVKDTYFASLDLDTIRTKIRKMF